MTEKDYEKEEFRLYVTGFNGHNPFYKQTAYLDFRWRLLDLHEIQLTKHVACATDLVCGTRDIWCNSPNLKTSPVHYKGIDIVEELVRCFMEEKNFDYDKTNSRSYFEGSVYKKDLTAHAKFRFEIVGRKCICEKLVVNGKEVKYDGYSLIKAPYSPFEMPRAVNRLLEKSCKISLNRYKILECI